MRQTILGGMLLGWLAATVPAGADDSKVAAAEAPKAGVGELRYEWPKNLTGAIYASGSTQLLFQFKRSATRLGDTLQARRDFTAPDGTVAAREQAVYQGDALVSFEFEGLQTGAAGSAILRRAAADPAKGTIEFSYTKHPGERPKVRTETLQGEPLMSDMVGPFVVAHWEALQRGEKVKCRYLVISRRETVGFAFAKTADLTWRGREAVLVKMQATSPFIAALVDPLVFTLEKAPPHRVLQYTGRTTPKVRTRGEWKELDGVTVFDWDSAR